MWTFVLADTVIILLQERETISLNDIREELGERRKKTLTGPLLGEITDEALVVLDEIKSTQHGGQ